jgi:hypothetical protein
MKTIEEVLELAEKLNELSPTTGYISAKVEGLDAKQIKALSDQENGNYYKGDSIILPADWASVRLGKVDFILSSKKIEKVKPIF